MLHRDQVENYDGTLEDLAEDLGNLRYDALAEFLRLLSAKIASDSQKDQKRSRQRLASGLAASAASLAISAEEMEQVWRICEPYMHT